MTINETGGSVLGTASCYGKFTMTPEEASLVAGIRLALDDYERAVTPPADLHERLLAALEALRPATRREKAKMVGALVEKTGDWWIVHAVMDESTFDEAVDGTVDSLLRTLVARDRPDLAAALAAKREQLIAVCEARAKTRHGLRSGVEYDGPRETGRPAWEAMLADLLRDLHLPSSRRTLNR